MKRLMVSIAAAVLATIACAAPANDNFANATPISGVEGSVAGTTAGATLEPGEFGGEMDGMPVKTVWFKWTAPADATTVAFYIDAVAGYYEPSLVVAAGNAVDKLDYEVSGQPRAFLLDDYYVYAFVPADVTPGQTYHIAVASIMGDMDFRLGWKAATGFSPVVDDGILLGCIGECPETLYIPNTVTWIAEDAFKDCDNLYTVIFSESVAGIGGGAFAMCSNLSDLTFNKGMSVIEDEAFATCNGLAGETLRLPWFLKKATGNAFPGIYDSYHWPDPSALTVEAPQSVQDTLYSGLYGKGYASMTELTVNYFNYSTDGLVNMKLHPEGGEFNRGLRLSMVDKIGDYGSTIIEMWKNKADWNNAISRKPTKDGYVFDGFWTAPDGGKQIWDADMKYVKGTGYWSADGKWIGSSTTMDAYAHWKEDGGAYTVRYRKYDGSGETAEEDFACGKTYTLAWMDSQLGWMRPGYEFVGWVPWNPDTKPRLCKYVNGQPVKDLAKAGETIDLWAGWKSSSSYRVCFHRCAGPDDLEKMNQVILRNKEDNLAWMDSMIGWTREGYTFLGWDESDKAATVKHANGAKVKNLAMNGGTKHLYAVWRAKDDHKYPYTVKYYKYDGSGATRTQSFKAGTVQSLLWMDSQLGWSRPGYEFIGWVPWNPDTKPRLCKYANGQKVVDLASKSGEVVSLYPAWKSSSSYRVCFNRNDGTGVKMNQVILRNKEDNLAWMDSMIGWKREGYVFKGWAESEKGAVKYANGAKVKNLAMNGGTKHLYAIWRLAE